ncbi:type IV secretory system conjugative DNA transfer family protein [Crossiella cryophila]|uniref:Type IV secretion system coupling protein TraD DNA-binding domain-containing protein n=1 Tax=Crossiella cryophila TaxID=43355 RepID=A0A7W7FVX5_9PSEU|nr:TraM recognition domain-containing protein [Crossiella cryophila]MBB4679460.1 hypothetical protein [Crossiella cryophila]
MPAHNDTAAHAGPRRLTLTPADDRRRQAPKPLGHADAGPARRVVLRVPDARYHLHICGETGAGKTTLLLNLALADIYAGRGLAVIEPRGDLIRDLLDRMPADAGQRLVLIDPDETEAPPSLNVLDPTGLGGETVADQLVSTLHRLYHAWWGPRVEDTLRAATLTLTRQPGATLADIPLLLTNTAYRRQVTAAVRAEDPTGIGAFWHAFDQLTPTAAANAMGPVLSKLRAVTTRRFVADLFGTARSSFHPADILDGGILLARLPKGELGEDTSRLVGSLLLSSLWQATTARAGQPEPHRRDATVLVDECQNYLHLPTPLDDALTESRGYHVSWVLAHQHLDQLTTVLRTALSANARNKILLGVSPEDARHFAPHVGPHLSALDLHTLNAYQAACRLVVANTNTTGFTLRTQPPPPAIPGRAEQLRHAARRQGLPRATRQQNVARRRRRIPGPDEQAAHPITDL